MHAAITALEYHLPQKRIANDDLLGAFPGRSASEMEAKIGIAERRVASETECASDLAAAAAEKLFSAGAYIPSDVDFLLFCTQSPDYFLPTTACLLQDRLGIPTSAGALDFNLGCSGFVYGLALAKGLVETGQARRVLLLTADTYSKFLRPDDRSVRLLFGDAGAAAMISAVEEREASPLGPFLFGTDGSGAKNLIVENGALRSHTLAHCGQAAQAGIGGLHMNGPAILDFTLKAVPQAVGGLMARAGLGMDDVDLFVFHQASKYILDLLRRALAIPEEKFYVSMRDCGNTVSSTIPIALRRAALEGRLRPGGRVVLAGFGVGYSWSAALLTWQGLKTSSRSQEREPREFEEAGDELRELSALEAHRR